MRKSCPDGGQRRLAVLTLGCKVNQYESQAIREQFLQAGYEAVEENQPADVYVINTCTVTGLSDKKSRQCIRRARRLNPGAIVVVTGCYAQISPEEAGAIEGVDIVCGTGEKANILQYVEDFLTSDKKLSIVNPVADHAAYDEFGTITAMESRTRAFIKIQDGCDRFCAYCIIPHARGAIRSRKREDILREAGELVSRGFRELVLTGINTALYGLDEGRMMLDEILWDLGRIPGDFRIRLGSLEPTVIDADYAGLLARRHEKLCPHMHLSLQSGSDTVLERMGRHYTLKDYKKIVEALRAQDPGYGITTDIIVGFPGETEEEFQQTLEAVGSIGFTRVHVFKYSRRTGTKAAEMPGQVPPAIKSLRASILSEQAERESVRFRRALQGLVRPVLIEAWDPMERCYTGYTDNYIKAVIPAGARDEGGLLLNRFVAVRLERTCDDGMAGSIGRE